MHYNTHRFEKDYLNSLVGNYSKDHDDYINRSPINHINKIKKPILLFHGKKDTVISYKQTLKIQEILIQNNKYSEVIFFDNEGHGFRNIENKEAVMQKSQEFLKNALNIKELIFRKSIVSFNFSINISISSLLVVKFMLILAVDLIPMNL